MENWNIAFAGSLSKAQNSRKQFFFREKLPDCARNIFRIYPHSNIQKLGVMMEKKSQGDENYNVYSFCGSIVKIDNGYRMYYTMDVPDFSSMWIAVAESPDGLHWEEKHLGQWKDKKKYVNRIVFDNFTGNHNLIGQPQVVRDRNGNWLMYFWHHENGYRYTIAHSEDGLRWHVDNPPRWVFLDTWLNHRLNCQTQMINGWEPAGEGLSAEDKEKLWHYKSLRTNDASYVYFNEKENIYEYYAQWIVPAIPDRRVDADNYPYGHRYIQRRVSEDGYRWTPPELIIVPDYKDPWDIQFYHLAVQWYEDWLIGSLGHYRVEEDQQTQDMELVFSRDGRSWERPLRGGFIPRGKDGEYDSEGIYPPNAWIDEGITWLCLYTGTTVKHKDATKDKDKVGSRIMAARWPKNRFIGLAAGKVPGGFLSDIFVPQGNFISIDANIRGWLKAELCDVFGRKITGYHLDDSIILKGDDTGHILRWGHNNTASSFRYDAVRLRFEFQDAEIYGICF